MTYPITPDPSIHNLPPAVAAQQRRQTTQQIIALGQQLVQAVVKAVLYILTGGLLGGTGADSAAALQQFQNLFQNLFKLFGITDPAAALAGDTGLFDPAPILATFTNTLLLPLGLLTGQVDFQDLLNKLWDGLTGNTGSTGKTIAHVLSAVQDAFTRWQNLDVNGLFDASFLSNITNIPAIAQSKVTNLVTDLTTINDNWQELVDTIVQATNSLASTGQQVSDVLTALKNFPNVNVLGYDGPVDIGQTIQATWDQIYSGFVNAVGTGISLPEVFSVTNQIGSWANLGMLSWDKLGFRANKPIWDSPLPTGTATMPLTQISGGASATTVGVTQSNTLMAFKRFTEDTNVNFISWLGSGVTSISSFYVDVWKFNPTLNSLEWVGSAGNVLGNLSPSMQYNVVQLTSTVTVAAGDVLAAELIPVGSGTHSVAYQTSWLPDHPSVKPKRMAARKNMSGTITQSGRSQFGGLSDTFDARDITYDFTTEDDFIWTFAGTAGVSGGELVMQTSTGFDDHITTDFLGYNVLGGSVSAEFTQPPASDPNHDIYTGFTLSYDGLAAGNQYVAEIGYFGGQLETNQRVGGVDNKDASVTFDPVAHRFMRIREADGTLFWETSPDNSTWTLQRSEADLIDVSGVQMQFWSGHTAVQTSQTVKWDNFFLDSNESNDPWVTTGGAAVSDNYARCPYDDAKFFTLNAYDFHGKQVWVEVPEVATGTHTWFFLEDASNGDFIYIVQISGSLYFGSNIAGVANETSITYNATTHRWWKINWEGDTGSNITFETSPNGLDQWTVRRSLAMPGSINPSSMKLGLQRGTGGSGTSSFDNLNICPIDNLTYSGSIPWIEFAEEGTSSPGTPYHSPQKVTRYDDGYYLIPDWANYVDAIVLGAGGGSHDGAFGFDGEGGYAGDWNWTTWVKGTHFFTGDSVYSDIGAGGGNVGTDGQPGGTTTAWVNDNSVSAAGGAGGTVSATTAAQVPGKSPGNIVVNGWNYVGGGQQNSKSATGIDPGGGAGGGYQPNGQGVSGANGRVWYRFYQ